MPTRRTGVSGKHSVASASVPFSSDQGVNNAQSGAQGNRAPMLLFSRTGRIPKGMEGVAGRRLNKPAFRDRFFLPETGGAPPPPTSLVFLAPMARLAILRR